MPYMFVTLEVSQLPMSSLKFDKPENSRSMFVIAETPQPEIGPYVLRAVARSLTHIWTAVPMEPSFAKDGGGDSGGAEGGAGGGGHVPETQLEPYSASKADSPAQAQRMSSLFASDNADVPPKVPDMPE